MFRFDRWLDLFSVVPSSNPRPQLERAVKRTRKLRKVTVVPVVIGTFETIS